MKYILFLTSLFISTTVSAQILSNHTWKDRVILIFSPSFQHQQLALQTQQFSKYAREMEDRELVVYKMSPSYGIQPNGVEMSASDLTAFYQKYGISEGSFSVLLIGKDGGVKLRESKAVSMLSLFQLIDRMPMRRSEMRDKN